MRVCVCLCVQAQSVDLKTLHIPLMQGIFTAYGSLFHPHGCQRWRERAKLCGSIFLKVLNKSVYKFYGVWGDYCAFHFRRILLK